MTTLTFEAPAFLTSLLRPLDHAWERQTLRVRANHIVISRKSVAKLRNEANQELDFFVSSKFVIGRQLLDGVFVGPVAAIFYDDAASTIQYGAHILAKEFARHEAMVVLMIPKEAKFVREINNLLIDYTTQVGNSMRFLADAYRSAEKSYRVDDTAAFDFHIKPVERRRDRVELFEDVTRKFPKTIAYLAQ